MESIRQQVGVWLLGIRRTNLNKIDLRTVKDSWTQLKDRHFVIPYSSFEVQHRVSDGSEVALSSDRIQRMLDQVFRPQTAFPTQSSPIQFHLKGVSCQSCNQSVVKRGLCITNRIRVGGRSGSNLPFQKLSDPLGRLVQST